MGRALSLVLCVGCASAPAVDAGPDSGTVGEACTQEGSFSCNGGAGYACCRGRWHSFVDGPCDIVPDAGTCDDVAADAGRCFYQYTVACTDGRWIHTGYCPSLRACDGVGP